MTPRGRKGWPVLSYTAPLALEGSPTRSGTLVASSLCKVKGLDWGWWQAEGIATQAGRAEGRVPPSPMVGAQSQMQLLTPCIIITANSPLKRNYHQYDISRQQGK